MHSDLATIGQQKVHGERCQTTMAKQTGEVFSLFLSSLQQIMRGVHCIELNSKVSAHLPFLVPAHGLANNFQSEGMVGNLVPELDRGNTLLEFWFFPTKTSCFFEIGGCLFIFHQVLYRSRRVLRK